MTKGSWSKLETSAWLTFLGVGTLFGLCVSVVLVAPLISEKQWSENSSEYQRQMYELADENVYVSTASSDGKTMHTIYQIRSDRLPLGFVESETMRIIAREDLEKYITHLDEPKVKLTHRLLLLRLPLVSSDFDAPAKAENLRREVKSSSGSEKNLRVLVFELYDPQVEETFTVADSDGLTENWVKADHIEWMEPSKEMGQEGSLFIKNPRQYRLEPLPLSDGSMGWSYDIEGGQVVDSFEKLAATGMKFMSRAQLIELGEHLYAAEGCWYCHTDQTRTLIQDTVLNGLDHPAPVSIPQEYVYQRISFPGTKRNGPDLSRTGIRRSSRDWHMAHFWSPKTASPGSIMPSFRHFFDFDPRGTRLSQGYLPNWKFEAIYQYLMTKGTRMTPPDQAWWMGKDPMRTQERIESKLKAGSGK
jgi:cytochrome c oxidase cbb3-type subunit 2